KINCFHIMEVIEAVNDSSFRTCRMEVGCCLERGRPKTCSTLLQFSPQPGVGVAELASDSRDRNTHRFGGLLYTKSAEVPELDNSRLPFIESCQRLQCVVDRYQVGGLIIRVVQCVLELNPGPAATAFRSHLRPCMIYENLTHDRRGEIKEVCLISPVGA